MIEMDRNLNFFLSETQSDLDFSNLNSECEEASTPTDVFDISVFVSGEMDSLTKYLESETIVKEFVEESMEKSDQTLVASPPAKKCKIDPLALLALHNPAAYKKAIHDQKMRQEKINIEKQRPKIDPLALLALHNPAAYKKAIYERNMREEKDQEKAEKAQEKAEKAQEKAKKAEQALALLAMHNPAAYKKVMEQNKLQEKVDLDQSSDEDDDEEEDDKERNWDNSEWDEDCEAETSCFGVDENKDDTKDEVDESWKKSIREGDDYQANVPEDMYPYDDPSLDHNEDKKLWEPDQLSEDDVKEYLAQYKEAVGSVDDDKAKDDKWDEIRGAYPSACENNTKEDMFRQDQTVDNEQGLYLLLQCGYNTEEALRRAKLLRRLLLKQKYLAKKNCNVMANVPVEDY